MFDNFRSAARLGTFALLMSSHIAFGASFNYESARVKKVEIVLPERSKGTFKSKDIAATLKTKANHTFSQETFDSDLKKLSAEFAGVEPKISEAGDKLVITIELTPRPEISEITFEGNHTLKTKKLRKELGIKPGTPFDRAKFIQGFIKLKEFYIKKSYFESNLTYSTNFDSENDEVSIKIHVDEGKPGKIAKVRVRGIEKADAKEIKGQLFTRPHNTLTSWYTKTGTYQHDVIERDRLSVVTYFQNKGYADVQVTPRVDEGFQGKIDVIFDVALGPVYRVSSIKFQGNESFDNDAIERLIFLNEGDTYSPQAIQNTVKAIKELYGKNGYIEATVNYQQTLTSHKDLTYDVNFEIHEHERYCVGKVKVLGNYYTNPGVILNESLLVPGDVFDSRKIAATEARLRATGYFKKVNIYPLPVKLGASNAEGKKKPLKHKDIYIEVEEAQTGHATLSAGGSTTDSLYTALEISESNFNLGGIPYIFTRGISAMRGGGEFFHLRGSLGRRVSYYTIAWMTPYVNDSLWRLGFDINRTINRNQATNFDYRSFGEKIYASYPLSSFWTYGMRYHIVNTKNHFYDGATPIQRRIIGPGGLASSFGISFQHDSTNSPRRPSRGLRTTLEATYTGLGGSFTYWKFQYLNTQYIPLPWKNSGFFKVRANLKALYPFGKTPIIGNGTDRPIPLSDRFFLGGDTDLRGYKNDKIGPQIDAAGNVGDQVGDGKNPLGGISYAFASLEYVYPIIDPIQVFAFFDTGALSLSKFWVERFYMSCGVGVRVDILGQMPITIGYAHAINPDHRDQTTKGLLFSIGVQY